MIRKRLKKYEAPRGDESILLRQQGMDDCLVLLGGIVPQEDIPQLKAWESLRSLCRELLLKTCQVSPRKGTGAVCHESSTSLSVWCRFLTLLHGGALDLALACDLRVASKDAVFAHPGARLGIIIGRARARECFITVRRLTSGEAFENGLISGICDPVLDCALEIARTRS